MHNHRIQPDKFGRAVFSILAAAGCCLYAEFALAQSVGDEERIAAIRASSNEAIARQDALEIVSSLAPEYQITTGSGAIFQGGPEEEAESWAKIFAETEDIVYVRTPETIEVSSSLPRAFEHGNWVGSWTENGERREVGGSYTASWSEIEGEWKIRSEIFVTLFCNVPDC